MPAGDSTSGSSWPRASAFWMRRSISRTESTYSPSFRRSPGPSSPLRSWTLSSTESMMLRWRRRRAARHLRIGAVDGAEEPLEDDARVRLHRERRRRAAPGQPVLVGATEADVAGADAVDGVGPLEAELQRRQRRLLADRLRRDLIHRRPELQAGAARGPQRLDAGEERAGGLGVRPGGAGARAGPGVVEAAQQQQPVAVGGQRLERRRELERAALVRRCPLLHDDPVRHVDGAEAGRRPGRGPGERGERGHHAVEQRQRQRGAHAAEDGPAGEGFLGDHHDSDLRIRKGVLLATAATSPDQVRSSAAVRRLIRRTTGMSWGSRVRPRA